MSSTFFRRFPFCCQDPSSSHRQPCNLLSLYGAKVLIHLLQAFQVLLRSHDLPLQGIVPLLADDARPLRFGRAASRLLSAYSFFPSLPGSHAGGSDTSGKEVLSSRDQAFRAYQRPSSGIGCFSVSLKLAIRTQSRYTLLNSIERRISPWHLQPLQQE